MKRSPFFFPPLRGSCAGCSFVSQSQSIHTALHLHHRGSTGTSEGRKERDAHCLCAHVYSCGAHRRVFAFFAPKKSKKENVSVHIVLVCVCVRDTEGERERMFVCIFLHVQECVSECKPPNPLWYSPPLQPSSLCLLSVQA